MKLSLLVRVSLCPQPLLKCQMEISDYKSEDQFKPTETAIAPNGDIYVADGYGLDFIIQYDKSGNYIRHFGGKGNKDDNFDCCIDDY